MFDSPSDSPRLKGHRFANDSDTDARIEAEARASRLEEEIISLRKDNGNLKAQFEELQRISAQLEEFHQKNCTLNATVRDLKAESDGLRQRLDIALRANSDLTQRLTDEKTSGQNQREADHTTFQDELQKAKQQAKGQIDALYAQLQTAQTANSQLEVEQKVTANKVGHLIRNASEFFGANFTDLDGVIARLGILEIPAAPAPTNEVRASAPVDVSKC
jgi:chromosome segregation ATPase